MAIYTTTIRNLVEIITQKPLNDINEFLTNARNIIFNFSYPFYDESKRIDFENDFIIKFMNREIGYETPQLFLLNLSLVFNQVIPHFNNVFEKELSPLETYWETTTTGDSEITSKTATNTGKQTSSSQANTNQSVKNMSRYSDTPQNGIEGVIDNQTLTNVTINDNSGNGSSNSSASANFDNSLNEKTENKKDGMKHRGGNANINDMLKYITKYKSIEELFFQVVESRLFMNIYHPGI